MKLRIILALAVLTVASPAVRADMTAVPPPPGVLPADLQSLNGLERRHLRLVRRAERMCAVDFGWGGAGFRACVVGSVDNAVAMSGDPQLAAYHRALPFPQRYNSRRASPGWGAWAVQPR